MINKNEHKQEENLNHELEEFCNTIEWLIFCGRNLDFSSTFKSSCKQNGMVIAVDAKWGMGKSFFLSYFRKKIEEQGNVVRDYTYKITLEDKRQAIPQTNTGLSAIPIYYNAWENDYFHEPFISLVGQICSQKNINELKITEFKDSCKNIVKGMRQVFKPVDVFCTIAEKENEKQFDDLIKSYLDLIDDREKFRSALSGYLI